jgi:carbamoyl-phosphate synthase large subunit
MSHAMNNVLLTCVGRRNYLVRFFQHALDGHGQVFAADASGDAAGMQEAQRAFLLPPLSHPRYLSHLLTLCTRNEVRLLVSLNDLELELLARHRDEFEARGVTAVVSSPEVIRACFDKLETGRRLAGMGLKVPRTWTSLTAAEAALASGELSFPVVVKPRWGSGSIGTSFPGDLEELRLAFPLAHRQVRRSILAGASAADLESAVLVQQLIAGQEFGMDVVNDLSGAFVTVLPRRKLSMRAGETDKAVTHEDERLVELGGRLSRGLRHVGGLDCDVIDSPEGLYVLDLNPRFGGGYPFSHAAGANLPAALLAWARGQQPRPEWLQQRPGVTSAKYDTVVVASRPPLPAPALEE